MGCSGEGMPVLRQQVGIGVAEHDSLGRHVRQSVVDAAAESQVLARVEMGDGLVGELAWIEHRIVVHDDYGSAGRNPRHVNRGRRKGDVEHRGIHIDEIGSGG